VNRDPNTGSLIYERKLRLGDGPHTYGILVAESLELPREFIDKAYEIVNYVTGVNKEIVNPIGSRYNNDMYVDSCAMCHRTKAQVELHTHHIIEQKYANVQGVLNTTVISDTDGGEIVLGPMHKNKRDNLIVLCRECHTNLHNEGKELETLTVPTVKIIRLKPDVPASE